jgi:hypothetical protein
MFSSGDFPKTRFEFNDMFDSGQACFEQVSGLSACLKSLLKVGAALRAALGFMAHSRGAQAGSESQPHPFRHRLSALGLQHAVGFGSYAGLSSCGFDHTVSRPRPEPGRNLLAKAHRVASLR